MLVSLVSREKAVYLVMLVLAGWRCSAVSRWAWLYPKSCIWLETFSPKKKRFIQDSRYTVLLESRDFCGGRGGGILWIACMRTYLGECGLCNRASMRSELACRVTSADTVANLSYVPYPIESWRCHEFWLLLSLIEIYSRASSNRNLHILSSTPQHMRGSSRCIPPLQPSYHCKPWNYLERLRTSVSFLTEWLVRHCLEDFGILILLSLLL